MRAAVIGRMFFCCCALRSREAFLAREDLRRWSGPAVLGSIARDPNGSSCRSFTLRTRRDFAEPSTSQLHPTKLLRAHGCKHPSSMLARKPVTDSPSALEMPRVHLVLLPLTWSHHLHCYATGLAGRPVPATHKGNLDPNRTSSSFFLFSKQ